MTKTFNRDIQIRFREADPAGILYFGNIFSLAHDSFEDFIVSAGLTWSDWFRPADYIVPIRHAESDFFAPFAPGEKYQVVTTVAAISESSFQMQYEFRSSAKLHATVKMVHTFVDTKSKKKIKVPPHIYKILNPYLTRPPA
jgi:acyl-CoA thioester hydrolase/1,4-dihydroxy-2-naphthoyl-CoA hydrolase